MKLNNFLLLSLSSVLLMYILVFRGVWGNVDEKNIGSFRFAGSPFESSHETAPYALMLSFLNDKSLSLTQQLANIASPDAFYFDGKFYIYFSPIISLFMIPFFVVGRFFSVSQIASFWSVILLGFVTMPFIYLNSRRILNMGKVGASLAVLLYGIGCTAINYATTIYQHQLTAAILMVLFYVAYKVKDSERKVLWGLLGSILYFFGVWLDYPNLVILLPCLLYLLSNLFEKIVLSRKEINFVFSNLLYLVILVVFGGLLTLGLYNNHYFKSPTKIINFLPRYSVDKPLVDANVVKKKPINVLNLKIAIRGLKVLLIDYDKGLFIFSPIFVLGILYIIRVVKTPLSVRHVLLFTFIANVFVYSIFSDPWGGWAFGPRYLIPSMSILSIFSVEWLLMKINLFRKTLFFILYIFSSTVALSGAVTTNLIPPSTEFASSQVEYYSFLQNFHLIFTDKVSSFVYKSFFHVFISGQIYFLFLVIFSLVLCFYFLTAISKHER